MAIKKTITNLVGAVMDYHKIGMIDTNKRLVDVTVYSYANQDIREKEKAAFEAAENFDAYTNQLAQLQQTLINDASDSTDHHLSEEEKITIQEQIADIEAKLNLARSGNANPFSLQHQVFTLAFDADSDISMQKCYEKLKEFDIFSGAEDC